MASISKSGPGEGVDAPEEVESFRVEPEDVNYMAEHGHPVLVFMWHGNGYKRDDCWFQIDASAACNLDSWL